MFLTKNEKRVLKLLLEDARLSDTSISNKLNISNQAVGRIRKKLEEEIIENYTLNINLKKLKINLFYMANLEMNSREEEGSLKVIEENIVKDANVICFIRLAEGLNNYFAIGGYKDISDYQNYVQKWEKEGKISEIAKIKHSNFFSVENILKNTSKDLIIKAIDELGLKSTNIDIKEKKFDF